MNIEIENITFDCDDVEKLAQFWSQVIGMPIDPEGNEFVQSISTPLGEPNFLFLKVPEAKSAKNRMHLDFASNDRDAEVERLVGLGATKIADKDEWGHVWTVMQDVEGNEFCVASKG